MLRKLYDWTMRMAEHPNALWVLAAVSFAESSFFPIPPDLMMIPMILARRDRAFLIAAVATVSSVLGGVLGYLIGMFAFETVGQPLLEWAGKSAEMDAFSDRFNDFGFWAVLGAGITPFPYKVITIMSGFTAMPFSTFFFTSLIARSLRFFVMAALLWKFGAPIRDFIERRLALVATAFFVLLLGGFYMTRYL